MISISKQSRTPIPFLLSKYFTCSTHSNANIISIIMKLNIMLQINTQFMLLIVDNNVFEGYTFQDKLVLILL